MSRLHQALFILVYVVALPMASAMLSGCLAAQLRGPAEDMAVAAEVAAHKHAEGELDADAVQVVLEQLAEQAREIEKIAKGSQDES